MGITHTQNKISALSVLSVCVSFSFFVCVAMCDTRVVCFFFHLGGVAQVAVNWRSSDPAAPDRSSMTIFYLSQSFLSFIWLTNIEPDFSFCY